MTQLETKFVGVDVDAVDETGIFTGYASKFGLIDGGGDMIKPGAYAASLATGRKVKMLWQHDPFSPIGGFKSLSEDTTGLWVEGRITIASTNGRNAYEHLKAGDVDGMSIGYRTEKASKRADGGRLLERLSLYEISLVTFPMDESAKVASVKSRMDNLTTAIGGFEADDAALKRIVENILCDAGMSAKEAKTFVSHGVSALRGARDATDIVAMIKSRIS